MVNTSLNSNWHTVKEHLLKQEGDFSISFHMMTKNNEIVGADMISMLPEEMADAMVTDGDTHHILTTMQSNMESYIVDWLRMNGE